MDYFLFLMISYPPTFHELLVSAFPLRFIIHDATSMLIPTKRKKNPMIYAIKSGLAITMIPKISERSQNIGIEKKLEKPSDINSRNIDGE